MGEDSPRPRTSKRSARRILIHHTLQAVSFPCPVCKAPVAPPTVRCDECLVALDWRTQPPTPHHPFIKPGDPLYFTDCTRSLLPGREQLAGTLTDGTRYETTPYGALVTVKEGRAMECSELRLRARDACVRASFTAIDPGITVSCVGRIDPIGTAKMKYILEVDPAEGRFCIDRGFSSTEVAQFIPLVPWTKSPVIAPLGQVNVVELRMQGPTLEARINDHHVKTIHDAVLGIGAAGIRFSTKPKTLAPQRATVQWFEMREVAP